jgi:hypothetical protein
MHAQPDRSPGSVLPSQPSSPIRVVIIYENRDAALRAKKALDRIAISFQNDLAFEIGVWSFGMFRIAQLRDVVMEDAVDADLIVISVETPAAIPPEVMSGITGWCGLKGGNPVALALLANTEGDENAGLANVWSQLKRVASEKSIDVLSGDLRRGGLASRRDAQRLRQMVRPPSPSMETISEAPHVDERWGLNE